MTQQYHATPYDTSATGFYFSTYEEYTKQAATHLNAYGDHVEEYEIQFIDGDNYKLFNALSVNQANLEKWFDDFEALDSGNLIKAIYLASDRGYNIDDILRSLDDVCLFEGTAEDYAQSYIEDTGMLSALAENLQRYFDVKDFSHDMLLGGDIAELRIDSTDYIVWGV